MNPRLVALLQAFGIIALAQLTGVLAKLALFDVDAFTFVWLQLATAIVFMVVYTVVFRKDRWPQGLGRAEWAGVVFVGIVNFGVCRVFMMLGIARLPINTFVFLLSFVSLVTLAFSILFLGERPGRLQLVGVVLAILGVRLFFPDLPPPEQLTGVAFAGIAVVGLAACNNVTRWLMSQSDGSLSPGLFSTLGLLIGGVPVVLAGLATDGLPEVGGTRNALIILVNGVVGIALAQTVFNSVLRTLRSFEASVVANSGLVWTALFAIPIVDEWLTGRQVVAILVVMAGVLLAQKRPVTPASAG